MRPTAMRVSRARVPLERSDANVVRDYTAYVVVVVVVVVRSSAAQRCGVVFVSWTFEPPFGALGFVIGRFVLILMQRRRHERAFVVRMRRDDAATTQRRRATTDMDS
jgi:hypothetical protein